MMSSPEMEGVSQEPLYNIGVVSRMTGISMATLRAWERRYDFPSAKRTSGGHRLYSEKDILQLRWVRDRIREGMQTAQAIQALRHQEKSGRMVYLEPETPLEKLHPSGVAVAGDKHAFLAAQQERLFGALMQHDTDKADELLAEALAISSPEEVILGVIAPVLNQIGEGWENGTVTISDEHLGTNYLRQRLLMWMLSGPPPLRTPPIVLACAPDEWHEGSLLILGALLRRRRWPIAYLGQAVPLADLATFVREVKPSLVVLVAMTEGSAQVMLDWPQWMPEVAESGKPIVGYGGRVFVEQPVWRGKMPGIYLGSSFEEGLNTIERAIQNR